MIVKLKKKVDIRLWHKWFAWHPIITENREWVWLRYVQRRVRGYYDRSWSVYRLHNPLLLLIDPGLPTMFLVKSSSLPFRRIWA